jgi:hypothetical protein
MAPLTSSSSSACRPSCSSPWVSNPPMDAKKTWRLSPRACRTAMRRAMVCIWASQSRAGEGRGEGRQGGERGGEHPLVLDGPLDHALPFGLEEIARRLGEDVAHALRDGVGARGRVEVEPQLARRGHLERGDRVADLEEVVARDGDERRAGIGAVGGLEQVSDPSAPSRARCPVGNGALPLGLLVAVGIQGREAGAPGEPAGPPGWSVRARGRRWRRSPRVPG